ncbi:hypothetical protein BLA29_002603 [Euroglyphus maynei]|uniref:Uncharacterized protein n=1 Tax=Euroglyphus maynei TaxID=6958 RepID=A0A1Y3ARK6_EURMA|nr:hypothetical protein BLA29_002603 [Euroglyphus maynei]
MKTYSRSNNHRMKRSGVGKQFKSNSIIYQSNYRKNHIHMTLENEMKSPTSHHRCNKSISDNSDNKKQQLPATTNKTNSSSSSSSGKQNEHDENNNRAIADSHKNDDRQTVIMIVKDGSNSNTITEYQQNRRRDLIGNTSSRHYVKHQNPTNAMTTGILMLKNKLTRNNQKTYVRKMSSDSQYEFSYYSNRKDSTSTNGRLSFSSDNPTKSTSSSFFSSGFSSTSGRMASSSTSNTATIIAGDLLLSQDQFDRIIEQSSIFTEQMKKCLINNMESIDDHEKLNILNSQHEQRFILISFIEQEFCNNEYKKQRSTNNDSNLNDDDGDSKQIDNKLSDRYILYLLQEIDSNSSSMTINRFNNLKVLLLYRKQLETDCLWKKFNAIMQLECIEHRLIDKFMRNLNESRILKILPSIRSFFNAKSDCMEKNWMK